MDILKILFIFLLLLFPLGELARFSPSPGIAFTPNDVAVAIVVVFWAIRKIIFNQKLNNFLTKPIFIFTGICLLSLAINATTLAPYELLASFLYCIRWVSYALLYFVTCSFNKKFKKTVSHFLTIVGIVLILGGFIQYVYYGNLGNLFYLGWDEHMYRMFSSFLDPNFVGAFYVLFLIFISKPFVAALKEKSKIHTAFYAVLVFFTFLSIFLTHSRSALLMLITSFSLLFFLHGKKKLIFGLIGVIIFVLVIFSPQFYIENINVFRVISTKARFETTHNAVRIIADHPILGVGFNSYRYAQIRYGFRKKEGGLTSHADAGVDNSYLFIFATTGILGLVSYLFVVRAIIKRQLSAYYQEKDELRKLHAIIVLASIAGLAINALFVNSLFYPLLMEWMWILVGLKENR